MTSDQAFVLGVGLGVVGFTLGVLLLIVGSGCVRRYQATRRRHADKGWVMLR